MDLVDGVDGVDRFFWGVLLAGVFPLVGNLLDLRNLCNLWIWFVFFILQSGPCWQGPLQE